MKKKNLFIENNKELVERVQFIRQNMLKRKRKFEENKLNFPISFWTKEDRLRSGIGKEFTIILRTKGCSWGISEVGGCSMCGYYVDSNIEDVPSASIINQFDYALRNKIDEINQDSNNYILKIFNSGSFLDENEISKEVRNNIYEKISREPKIKELVIESRLEYITKEKLEEIREFFDNKYVEIAIGLETVDDYIRNNYINKGILFNDFRTVFKRCKDYDIGIKIYLLLKPPFLNEQAAIDDCSDSLKVLIDLKVDTISINPMNIQKGTLTEYLWSQKRYRPPWYYSLFKCIRKSILQSDLKDTRVVSNPSGAGTKRGIHNCLKKDCENSSKKKLQNFVLSQELNNLDDNEYECDCKRKYIMEKDFF